MASSGRKRFLSGPCTSTQSKRKKYVCKYEQFWEKRVYVVKKNDTGENMAAEILFTVQTILSSIATHAYLAWF
jgi:hypothetical protein